MEPGEPGGLGGLSKTPISVCPTTSSPTSGSSCVFQASTETMSASINEDVVRLIKNPEGVGIFSVVAWTPHSP